MCDSKKESFLASHLERFRWKGILFPPSFRGQVAEEAASNALVELVQGEALSARGECCPDVQTFARLFRGAHGCT